MSEIQKSIPADWTKEVEQQLTFLNDKKIDAELYAYLLSISYGVEGSTIVYKKDIPKQKELCEIIGVNSRTTLSNHMSYLIERGYIEVFDGGYKLLNPDKVYFNIPLDTLQFLKDCMTQNVIKAYVIFGQWWRYSETKGERYSFTKEELAKRMGISMKGNNKRTFQMINNIIDMLTLCGFIEIKEYYEGARPRLRLVKFSDKRPLQSFDELSSLSNF